MSNVAVLISDRYHPERGLTSFDATNYKNLVGNLNAFHKGEMGPYQIVNHIIESLFDSEFTPDRKWDVDPSSCDLISGQLAENISEQQYPISFDCEKKATYNHKDIYSVARAHATIVVHSKELVHIELYSFYVSG